MSKGLLGTLYWYLEVNITTTSTNQISQPDSRQILRHQYGISVERVTDVSPGETSLAVRNREKREEHGLISQTAVGNLVWA